MNELIERRRRVAETDRLTQLKSRSRTALEANRNDSYLLADVIFDVVWTLDLNLRFNYFSPAITTVLGYDIDEAIRLTLRDIHTPASGDALIKKLSEELVKEKSDAEETSRVWTMELEQICKDGSSLWTETKIGFLRDKTNEAVGFIGISRDITERRRLENQLQQSRLLSSLSEMTATIANEVNNPLGGILLFSEHLMKSNVSPQAKRDLRVIHNEAQRAARMMTTLLNSCNVTAPKTERYKLHRLLNKVLEIRKYSHRTQNINVTTNLHKPSIYVNCDTAQLQQVFTRLILNAEAALQEQNGGNIVLTSRKCGDWVRVTIADDGHTNLENHLNKLANPLFTTQPQDGEVAALSLSLCHGIITSHGGLIYAENNKMGGTSFIIELPLA